MRVLGVDPGFDRLGLAVIEGDPSKPHFVWSDCIEPPKGAMENRLAVVARAIEDTIATYTPDALAIETLFFSTNRKTAISVGQARGAVLASAGNHALPVVEISPQEVKLAVTGHGAADKTAVARMLPKLIVLPPRKRRDDELDAIAVALAGLARKGV
jgi:crossover junction endodeoxyribonuclease RuvC